MLRVVVMVSGGGTNLQAIIDRVADGTITNAEIVGVISNNANAYALERAKNTEFRRVVSRRRSLNPEKSLMRSFWKQSMHMRLI